MDELKDIQGTHDFFEFIFDRWGHGVEPELAPFGLSVWAGSKFGARGFPLFFDRRTYTVSIENLGILRDLFERALPLHDFENYINDDIRFLENRFRRSLANLEGFSIVVDADVLEKGVIFPTAEQIFSGAGWITARVTSNPKQIGRPRKQIDEAKRRVLERFNGDHQERTAKEIFREIGDPVDVFSLKTLKRALVELDKMDGQKSK